MAVAGVVILYHPDESVIGNIQTYLSYIDKLYIADNTEGKMSVLALQLQKQSNIHLLYDGNNEGIAKRLNEAAELAIEEGYNWLLTMDQDSCFEEGAMENYLLCAGSFLHKDRTAMFGVETELKKKDQTECTPVAKNKLITSGSIVNLSLFTKVGGFDEQLFIDEVDFDYCYRARLHEYEIIHFSNIFLVHQLGKSSYHRSLKNMQLTHRSLHSPKRMYYMVRNFLYVSKRYKKSFLADIKQERKGLFNRMKNNLLYNDKRWPVFLSILRALRDYSRKNWH